MPNNYLEQTKYLNKYIKEKKLDDDYYDKCLKEIDKGLPIQYIIGETNFYGYDFIVNPDVLIPRFETELLVDKTIKRIEKKFGKEIVDIIDLGTGSGCIAITLKKEIPCNVTALDISNKALKVAKTNAHRHQCDITFVESDMTKYHKGKYDVIISNPPYIAYDEAIMDIVKKNEPHLALYAPNNGLYFYEAIIKNLSFIAKDDYLVCFEIGATESSAIVDIANKYLQNVNIEVEKDYNQFDRFIFITKKN